MEGPEIRNAMTSTTSALAQGTEEKAAAIGQKVNVMVFAERGFVYVRQNWYLVHKLMRKQIRVIQYLY